MKKKFIALKIIIFYILLGTGWVILSDKIYINLSFINSELLSKLQMYSEYIFLLISSFFLYFILDNMEIRFTNKIRNLKIKNSVLKQEIDVLNVQINISDYKAKKLEDYACMDELTGIYNRRRGMELIREELLRAELTKSKLLIGFVDVNNLKLVNDKFGHAEGDVLLATLCGILKNSVSANGIVCRYGGDEFLIVLPNACERDILKIKNRINNMLSNYNIHSNKTYAISCSIGFAEYNNEEKLSAEELIECADKVMYEDKRLYGIIYRSVSAN